MPNPFLATALNRYAYVYNNPFKYHDPSGHTPNYGGKDADDADDNGYADGSHGFGGPGGYGGDNDFWDNLVSTAQKNGFMAPTQFDYIGISFDASVIYGVKISIGVFSDPKKNRKGGLVTSIGIGKQVGVPQAGVQVEWGTFDITAPKDIEGLGVNLGVTGQPFRNAPISLGKSIIASPNGKLLGNITSLGRRALGYAVGYTYGTYSSVYSGYEKEDPFP